MIILIPYLRPIHPGGLTTSMTNVSWIRTVKVAELRLRVFPSKSLAQMKQEWEASWRLPKTPLSHLDSIKTFSQSMT